MPKLLLIITLFFLNLLPIKLCFAYTLNSVALGVPEGLSQSNVSSIVEDADGYLWIGTFNGLNRYDGQHFRHYFPSQRHELASGFIHSLLITRSGLMFIGTDKGLSIYDPLKDKITSSQNMGLSINEAVWTVYEHDNHIYIGTENKITIIHPLRNGKLKIKGEITGDFGTIKNIVSYNDRLFVRNYTGNVYSIASDVELISDKSNTIKVIDNKLLIFKNDGTFLFENDNLNKINAINFLSVTEKPTLNYAISKNKIYNINNIETPLLLGELNTSSKELEQPKIIRGKAKTFISNQNNGIIIIDDNGNIAKTKEIQNGNVWSINSAGVSGIIITTDSPLIRVLDNKLDSIKNYNSNIKGPKSAIRIRDRIYVASIEGLIEINTENKESSQIIKGEFFIVKAAANSQSLYIGATNGTVIQYFIKTGITKEYIVDNGNPIFDLKEYRDALFIASQGGIFKLEGGVVSPIYTQQIVISIDVFADEILIGTGNSLKKIHLDTLTTTDVYENNKPIYSIYQDENLIIASSINELFIKDKKTNQPYIFSKGQGVQDEYNAQSIYKLNDNILLGGLNGISLISLKKIKQYLLNHTAPTVSLSELLVFNIPETPDGNILEQQINKTEKIRLKHSDYPFTLVFNSPKSALNDISYIYQLRGLSDTKINSKGINSATYTNLSPGEYEFLVHAVDPITGLKGQEKTLAIEIIPPWWLSDHAKIIYSFLALFAFLLIVKIFLKRRDTQKEIAKSEERLKLSLWGSGDEMWDWDLETGHIYRSNMWGTLDFPRDGRRSGQAGEESNIHPLDQTRVHDELNKHFEAETEHFEATYRVKGKSGDWIWILDRAKIVERDEHHNPLRMTGTIKNISHFKQAEEQLKLFERAIKNISEGMFILDRQYHFVEVNEACCDLSMLSKAELIGTQLNFALYPDSYSQQIRSILKQQGRWSEEIESVRGDGTHFLMALTIDAIYDEQGELCHYVGVFSDISRRKQQEEELRKLTNNDLLTNLPNRSNLMVTLGNLVKHSAEHTLMVLDLDNFKKINDSLGHQVGDELLILASERIQTAVPYHANIYRLGGDEFAILIDKNSGIGISATIAKAVIHAFEAVFQLSSETVVVGVSIGIVLYPEDGNSEQALLRKADTAMYHAKSAGGNRYQFYSESLNKNAIKQLTIESLIREAIKKDLFDVYYQPKINLKTGAIAGMEALVRLNHPDHGLIPPNKFIPLAEENGLIVEIGDTVLKKACLATQNWRLQGLFTGRVAVNLSSKQFALPDLQQRVASILRHTQLPATHLELEITEGTVIDEPEKAIALMQQLSQMGVNLALDDFGTGYSSLSYLKRFPIHTLKIDKAFIDDIDKSKRDLKMVDSIITIAHNMGLSVVAEGVETAAQLAILSELDCEEVQGYVYSQPVTEKAFTQLLKTGIEITPKATQQNK
ncbi:EAL domain-containing protein [Shewanella sp.]|nr:EAL domain-containing protein [Shewanella sp.]